MRPAFRDTGRSSNPTAIFITTGPKKGSRSEVLVQKAPMPPCGNCGVLRPDLAGGARLDKLVKTAVPVLADEVQLTSKWQRQSRLGILTAAACARRAYWDPSRAAFS